MRALPLALWLLLVGAQACTDGAGCHSSCNFCAFPQYRAKCCAQCQSCEGGPTPSPVSCPQGKYKPSQSECKNCPNGKYSDGSNKEECKKCPAGKMSDSIQHGPTSRRRRLNTKCTLCARGKAAKGEGNHKCNICPNGSFADSEGEEQCLGCPGGKHQNQEKCVQHTCTPPLYCGDKCSAYFQDPTLCVSDLHDLGLPSFQLCIDTKVPSKCDKCHKHRFAPSIGSWPKANGNGNAKCVPCPPGESPNGDLNGCNPWPRPPIAPPTDVNDDTLRLDRQAYKSCPSIIDSSNWVGHRTGHQGKRFKVEQDLNGPGVCVRRDDSKGGDGWTMNLRFFCGGALCTIGSNDKNWKCGKCFDYACPAKVSRVNWIANSQAMKDSDVQFQITKRQGGTTCAERIDGNKNEWNLDLHFRCGDADCHISSNSDGKEDTKCKTCRLFHCPRYVNKDNWLTNRPNGAEKFVLSVDKKQEVVCAKRIDKDDDWNFDLEFFCGDHKCKIKPGGSNKKHTSCAVCTGAFRDVADPLPTVINSDIVCVGGDYFDENQGKCKYCPKGKTSAVGSDSISDCTACGGGRRRSGNPPNCKTRRRRAKRSEREANFNRRALAGGTFRCPGQSYFSGEKWPATSFDDCTCEWGLVKDVDKTQCVAPGVGGAATAFVCPANSYTSEGSWPPASLGDCTCEWGFQKDLLQGTCVAATASHTALNAFRCPANSYVATRGRVSSMEDCACEWGFVKHPLLDECVQPGTHGVSNASFACPPHSYFSGQVWPPASVSECTCFFGYDMTVTPGATGSKGACRKAPGAVIRVAKPSEEFSCTCPIGVNCSALHQYNCTSGCPRNSWVHHWPVRHFGDCTCDWGFERVPGQGLLDGHCARPTPAQLSGPKVELAMRFPSRREWTCDKVLTEATSMVEGVRQVTHAGAVTFSSSCPTPGKASSRQLASGGVVTATVTVYGGDLRGAKPAVADALHGAFSAGGTPTLSVATGEPADATSMFRFDDDDTAAGASSNTGVIAGASAAVAAVAIVAAVVALRRRGMGGSARSSPAAQPAPGPQVQHVSVPMRDNPMREDDRLSCLRGTDSETKTPMKFCTAMRESNLHKQESVAHF